MGDHQWKTADQAALENFSIARLKRAVRGASVCSVSFIEASVSLPDSASVFSRVERARFACRSNASFNDRTEEIALKVDTVSSNEACALAASCFEMSCTPAAQIWPDFTIASRLPWPN